MINNKFLVAAFITLATTVSISNAGPVPGKERTEMTQEEIDKSIGRMGEVEEIPEGFEFSEMEVQLWQTNHLENIKSPARLYYEFSKTGSYEEGFDDSIYLDVLQLNDDGSKNTNLQFFSGERKQTIRPDNVTNITGNPVLGIFLQGDMYEMDRFTGGSWRHFMKQMKISFREEGKVEPVTFEYNGKTINGKKYSVQPFLKDERRRQYEEFANKIYEFTFSEEVPGQLYEIHTLIAGKEGDTEPYVEEKITLVEVTKE